MCWGMLTWIALQTLNFDSFEVILLFVSVLLVCFTSTLTLYLKPSEDTNGSFTGQLPYWRRQVPLA
jgi:hypothetical protein